MASYDGTAKVWDADSGVEMLTLRGHTARVGSASFCADGNRIVTASDDHTAKVWTLDGNELIRMTESLVQRYTPWLRPEERRQYELD